MARKKRTLETASAAACRVACRDTETADRRHKAVSRMIYGWTTARIGVRAILSGLWSWLRPGSDSQ